MERRSIRTDRASTVAATRMRSSFQGVRPGHQQHAQRASDALAGSALACVRLVRYADSFIQIQNSLKVAGVETANMAAATKQNVRRRGGDARPRPGAGRRCTSAPPSPGLSSGSPRTSWRARSELAAKAVTVAGSSTAAADGALRQFGQAVGSARVELEEFRSIQDGALPILQAVSRGLLEAGGSVNKLRELIKNGQVSGEGFFRAFLAGSDGIDEAFSKTESTVGQAMTVLNNSLTELVGGSANASGATTELANSINGLATELRNPVFQTWLEELLRPRAPGAPRGRWRVQEANRALQFVRDGCRAAGHVGRGSRCG